MNMQVRDALVDRVVYADKATPGAEGGRHGRAHRADPGEERRNEFGRQVGQRLMVGFGG
jgi:hypothetical protein